MDEPRRIIDLTETQLVGSGDYLALDSADGGTKKVKASYFSGGSENYMWGGIQGDIADQTDLYEYLEQLPEKANIDGYYEDMSVGSAEQLLSNMFEDDSTPYLYRTSGGSLEIGDRVYEDAIVGGSVAWNQLVENGNFASTTGWFKSSGIDTFSVADNVATLTFKTTQTLNKHIYRPFNMIAGHKYYFSAYAESSVITTRKIALGSILTVITTTANQMDAIATSQTDLSENLVVGFGNSDAAGSGIIKNVHVHDLTLILGSTIADYAYTLETSEAGSGIAWLKSQGFFSKDYYPYNAGGIQSVKTSAKKVVGFNAYDNATGKAHLVGGHEYQITGAYTALAYSTGETITPDANGKFTPSADGELTVTGGNATTTCVHLVWDGERDGEYEAYEEHTYPLDSDLELRGIPKLVDGKIKYDGDTCASDGSVTRRFASVNLGEINWTYHSSGNMYSDNVTPDRVLDSSRVIAICGRYIQTVANITGVAGLTVDKTFGVQSSGGVPGRVIIRDTSYTDAATFKTAMSGVYLVYELATPTTESADPYTNPQWVDNWGTEEFVDTRDVPVPVGHDSRYLPDLKAKLESAPNNPSTNGKYFLQYQNGEATYVPVPSEVPQTPSEDGTYVLKATVSGGTATLAWVAEE